MDTYKKTPQIKRIPPRSSLITNVTKILLTSLAPSSHLEFSMSILILNVRRAPEMSTLFG